MLGIGILTCQPDRERLPGNKTSDFVVHVDIGLFTAAGQSRIFTSFPSILNAFAKLRICKRKTKKNYVFLSFATNATSALSVS